MSRHHKKTKHTTHVVTVRAIIAAQLPRPCVDCGKPVAKTDQWEVGHIVPAALGGRTTLQNCGPSHRVCNRRAGGKLGRSMQLRSARARKDIREW